MVAAPAVTEREQKQGLKIIIIITSLDMVKQACLLIPTVAVVTTTIQVSYLPLLPCLSYTENASLPPLIKIKLYIRKECMC